jgi:uncharacterized protein (DUF58 family)
MKPKITRGSTTLIDSLTVVGGLFFLIDLFNGSLLLFMLSCFMLVLGIYPRFYISYVSRCITFMNSREKRFVIAGDQVELLFSIANSAPLPVLGEVHVTCDPVLHIEGKTVLDKKYMVPISVHGQSTLEMSLPFSTMQRGVGRITQLDVHLSDPLRLLKCQIEYEFVRKEVVIYPKKQAVAGEGTFSLLKEGTKANPFSLFHDLSLPIGTRDYRPGDSLKAIHWKATARKNELQTKLVEKTIGITWSFVVLIGQNMGKEAVLQLEDQLSTLARLTELAYKQGIMFDLYINTKPMGRGLITQTLEGHDRAHYFKIMERLARIQVNFLRIDPKLAIREMNKAFQNPRILFLAGAVDEITEDPLLKQWVRKGHRIISIGEAGQLKPIGKGGERIAT